MRFLRRLLLRAALGVAVIFERPTPAALEPVAVEADQGTQFEVELFVRARHTEPVPAELLAKYRQQADEFWTEHYRGLPEQLAAVTRRAAERRKQAFESWKSGLELAPEDDPTHPQSDWAQPPPCG